MSRLARAKGECDLADLRFSNSPTTRRGSDVMGAAIMMAAIMATPFMFQNYWQKRWFRVCWWIGVAIVVMAVLSPPHGNAP